MFDFWKLGSVVLGITLLYFLFVGFWLFPKRNTPDQASAQDELDYLFEVKILDCSKLTGKKIKDSLLRRKYKVRVMGLYIGNKKRAKSSAILCFKREIY